MPKGQNHNKAIKDHVVDGHAVVSDLKNSLLAFPGKTTEVDLELLNYRVELTKLLPIDYNKVTKLILSKVLTSAGLPKLSEFKISLLVGAESSCKAADSEVVEFKSLKDVEEATVSTAVLELLVLILVATGS
ncbi:hypothetical protein FQA39_LY16472 [Lamprigera yunnana]|nr:hypothetical protein FQA39_LY16472 [Lamprigera yunnana]